MGVEPEDDAGADGLGGEDARDLSDTSGQDGGDGDQGGDNADQDAPQVDEVELKAMRAVARQMGWKPEADWKGDKSGWVDADAFIANMTSRNKAMRDQMQAVTRTSAKLLEKERAAHKAALEAKMRELVEANDADGVIEATRELAGLDDKALIDDFVERNPWFTENEEAEGLAKGAATRAARAGKSVAEQLEAAEAAVKRRMPELFEDDDATPPAPKPKPKPPMVQGGRRTAEPAARAKGWADLPPAVRQAAGELIKKKMVTEAEYAKAYFEENA